MKTRHAFRCFAVAFTLSMLWSAGAQPSEDWADSPEAYFLTASERNEWKGLSSSADRDVFKNRYWLRRDPTPNTPENEFRDMVMGRIKVANERFKIGTTEGARTARGFAFIVFGGPARVSETAGARPQSDPSGRSVAPPQIRPTGGNDGLESTVVWKYERDRTPKILEVLNRPKLEFTFFIEPERHRDRFEVERLPRELAAIVAERSIVTQNVNAMPTPAAPAAEMRGMPVATLATTALPPEAAAALAAEQSDERVRFGYASLLDKRQVTAWFFVPDSVQVARPKIVASINAPEGAMTNGMSMEATPTTDFLASEGGKSYGVRIPMPTPGTYSASFALVDGSRTVATGRIPKLVIEGNTAGTFDISSLVVTGGVGPAASSDAAFSWGDVQIMPRADSTFRFNESLWYFLQVANPTDAEKLVLDVRLRKGASPHLQPIRVPAQAGSIGNGLYLIGRELPLMSLEPGSYSLYVTVIDGANQKVARSDFKVLGPD